MINFIIQVANKKKILYIKDKSLLYVLKKNHIQIDYQCQSGYCGICRIQLIHGQISYFIKQPIAALFNKGEIFPCCCIPNSNIIIKI
ncbi:MAG: 2Fe-2S iron-sulfur cluster binding domain-containing protein [Buchnera aphidicola (Pentalonia nigronervosa)]|jgi:ferredoxin|uniref:2Fe-2S iron-sulfur cluster binding domain-containing protein n=1 Tax=Buchnera aphidicola (Pentalonia nigronervosa) TaxID=1309793 RepID=A0A7H1AZJ7_9GAMM|nr:MAG: 2Fe-2S iron-sulfur cluster binding domain-containing protein [Buchnera aphidicola (Pentalonia nigronervosa)]